MKKQSQAVQKGVANLNKLFPLTGLPVVCTPEFDIEKIRHKLKSHRWDLSILTPDERSFLNLQYGQGI